MNKAEVEFIAKSWYLKEKRFNELKKERDEARRMLRANANVLKILKIDRTNPTLALRMAEANYLLYPTSSAAEGIFKELLGATSKARTIKTIKTIKKGNPQAVYSLTFSPDRTTFLSGPLNSTAKLWDMEGNLSLIHI